jgi:hypothetical protein
MTTSQHQLADSFRHLTARLAQIDDTDAPRAAGVRARLAAHMDQLTASLDGKTEPCRQHRGWPAHNCAPCRSERIGAA